MLGPMKTSALRHLVGVLGAALLLVAAPRAIAQPQQNVDQRNGIHLGVASCSGSSCHGADERQRNSTVQNDEFKTWQRYDRHSRAYTVLKEDRARRMARALGYPNSDASTQRECLVCHADNVPKAMQGPQFDIADGVGCEACHGGASGWLGIHISGATHQQNVERGLYPTEKPVARAQKCAQCHVGDAEHFLDHRMMAAGHPPLPFETDTFTAIQPAHFTVDASYVKRKGRITDMQVWAAGEAVLLSKHMEMMLDPKRLQRGPYPDFMLFECASCHHAFDAGKLPLSTLSGADPQTVGSIKLNDANYVMLRVAAMRVAPDAARNMQSHMLALHRAAAADWAGARREAAELRKIADALAKRFEVHEFSRDDMLAFAVALVGLSDGIVDAQYQLAEQITMSLEAVVNALKSSDNLSETQNPAVTAAMSALLNAFDPTSIRTGRMVREASETRWSSPNKQGFRSEAFAKAAQDVQRALGR